MFVQLTNNAHVGDDVVLNVDEMNMTSSVEYLEGESLKEFVGDGYVGNYRGVKSGEVTLLLKVAPFEMSLLVKGESVMSLNTNQMMHFEKKRDPTTKEKRKLTVTETFVDVKVGDSSSTASVRPSSDASLFSKTGPYIAPVAQTKSLLEEDEVSLTCFVAASLSVIQFQPFVPNANE